MIFIKLSFAFWSGWVVFLANNSVFFLF